MADPLSIRVPISPEALLAAQKVSEAAKAAGNELRNLQREAKRTFEQTGNIDSRVEQRMRDLRELKRDTAVALQEQQRGMEQLAGQKDMVKDLKFFTRLSQAESIKRLATGQGDAHDIMALLGNKRVEKVLAKLGGAALGADILPAAYLAKFSYDRVTGAFAEARGDADAERQIRMAQKSGHISAAEQEYFVKHFNAFRFTGAAGKEALEKLGTLQKAHGFFATLSAGDQESLFAGKVLRQNIDNRILDKSRQLGRELNQAEKNFLAKSAFADTFNNWDDAAEARFLEELKKKERYVF